MSINNGLQLKPKREVYQGRTKEYKSMLQIYDMLEINGKLHIRYPWGQILPADGASSFFWGVKEFLLKALSEEEIENFFKDAGNEEAKNAIITYSNWVKETALKKQMDFEDKLYNIVEENKVEA